MGAALAPGVTLSLPRLLELWQDAPEAALALPGVSHLLGRDGKSGFFSEDKVSRNEPVAFLPEGQFLSVLL